MESQEKIQDQIKEKEEQDYDQQGGDEFINADDQQIQLKKEEQDQQSQAHHGSGSHIN